MALRAFLNDLRDESGGGATERAKAWIEAQKELKQLRGTPAIVLEVIAWAISNALLTSVALLSVLDSGLAPAPCLCCYGAKSPAHLRDVQASARLVARYFSIESHMASQAFSRTVSALFRDISPGEEKAIKAHIVAPNSPCRALNSIPGICVVAPACRENVLWVYSSALGRKLLRHAVRFHKRAGLTSKVSLLTEDPRCAPRFAQRIYVLAPAENGPDPAQTRSAFWGALADVAVLLKKAGPGPSSRPASHTSPPPGTPRRNKSGSRKAGR